MLRERFSSKFKPSNLKPKFRMPVKISLICYFRAGGGHYDETYRKFETKMIINSVLILFKENKVANERHRNRLKCHFSVQTLCLSKMSKCTRFACFEDSMHVFEGPYLQN